jgi:hypothetical protein
VEDPFVDPADGMVFERESNWVADQKMCRRMRALERWCVELD